MLWLADECVDARIVVALRVDGHDVLHTPLKSPAAPATSKFSTALNPNRGRC
jgi:hypothetical protein